MINVGTYGFPNANARKAKGTDYAKCQGLDVDDSGFSAWRLGSAGDFDDVVCNVGSDGSSFISNNVSATDCGIRPSCCLSNLTSDVSQSEIYTVTATADPTAGGTVTGGGTYTDGTTATVTATANSGYMFSGWYKGGRNVSSNKSYTFTVTGNVTLTAKFTPLSMSYNVTATADPAEGGTVSGGGSYANGKTANVTATPNSGWKFVGWYEGSSKVSDNASYSFTVTGSVTLTAKFAKLSMSYNVTATADPAEGGTVSGGGSYNSGGYATLTATPNSGWHFVGWYEGSSKVSDNASYPFTVTGSVTLTAKFEKDAAPDPGQPENPDNGNGSNGSNEPAANLCKWCGKDHSDGFFQKIVGWFHNILAKLLGKKFNPDGTPVQK